VLLLLISRKFNTLCFFAIVATLKLSAMGAGLLPDKELGMCMDGETGETEVHESGGRNETGFLANANHTHCSCGIPQVSYVEHHLCIVEKLALLRERF
jgi:hypothetical protein